MAGEQKKIFGEETERKGDPLGGSMRTIWNREQKQTMQAGLRAGLTEKDVYQKLFNLKLYDFEGLREVRGFWLALAERRQ